MLAAEGQAAVGGVKALLNRHGLQGGQRRGARAADRRSRQQWEERDKRLPRQEAAADMMAARGTGRAGGLKAWQALREHVPGGAVQRQARSACAAASLGSG